jgi:hypothetical protein
VIFSWARDLSGIIFQKPGVWLQNSGLLVDFSKVQGPFCKIFKITDIRNYF